MVQVISASDKNLENHQVQGKIRSSAEAFLAKKVVICEGATEVGFLRGFDDYQVEAERSPFAYHGVALLNVGGASNLKGMAEAFNSLNYSVVIVADGDAPKLFSKADEAELAKLGVNAEIWSDELSLEERAMKDLPWVSVLASVKLANDEFYFPAPDQVCSALNKAISPNIEDWSESPELRIAIGKAAKNSGWFNVTFVQSSGGWLKNVQK